MNNNKVKNKRSIKLCTNWKLCDTIPTEKVLHRSIAEITVSAIVSASVLLLLSGLKK